MLPSLLLPLLGSCIWQEPTKECATEKHSVTDPKDIQEVRANLSKYIETIKVGKGYHYSVYHFTPGTSIGDLNNNAVDDWFVVRWPKDDHYRNIDTTVVLDVSEDQFNSRSLDDWIFQFFLEQPEAPSRTDINLRQVPDQEAHEPFSDEQVQVYGPALQGAVQLVQKEGVIKVLILPVDNALTAFTTIQTDPDCPTVISGGMVVANKLTGEELHAANRDLLNGIFRLEFKEPDLMSHAVSVENNKYPRSNEAVKD